jgi:hypothetical protein
MSASKPGIASEIATVGDSTAGEFVTTPAAVAAYGAEVAANY